MKRTLSECAQRIINGYREVCTMTPHVECKPEESSDHAVRLAVHFQSLAGLADELRLNYVQRDDVAFDIALKQVEGIV